LNEAGDSFGKKHAVATPEEKQLVGFGSGLQDDHRAERLGDVGDDAPADPDLEPFQVLQ